MGFSTKPVLTVDIVEFSKRRQPNQIAAIQALIQLLGKVIPEEHIDSKRIIWSPAGDGGSLTFWGTDNYTALETAVALAKHIDQYNKGELKLYNGDTKRLRREPFQVRMGIHLGAVSTEIDFDKRENVWGPGVNMSARVTSLAKPGQIVTSFAYCKEVELLDDPDVAPIGKWWAKHNQSIVLYNIYKEGVGIPNEEVGEWFEPFQYPLQLAINTYLAMAQEEAQSPGGRAFRVLVLAKRLLDLAPELEEAQEIIRSVSLEGGDFTKVGEKRLFDEFFSLLSPSALLYFFHNAEFRDFDKGTEIFKQGSKADSMMMVVSGKIEAYLGKERIPDVELEEGDIIGEMGLFNPEGEKRTATLQASKNTITLSLDYDYLRDENGAGTPERKRIRERIWHYYCRRTRHNQIHIHPLFKPLSDKQRKKLRQGSEFLPANYNEPIQLDANYVWEHWILVAEGSMIVYTRDGNGGRRVEYRKGDCLGPIRLVVNASPYSKVEVSPNTHIVSLPWELIKEVLSEVKRFRQDCMLEGYETRERLGVEL